MKKLPLFSIALVLLCTNLVSAQTLESNTQWLSSHLDRLVKEEKGKNLTVNDKESVPTFRFKGCQMNMNIDSRDSDVNFGMTISWLLKDVQKVSYAREKDGNYELKMIVPADRLKMKLGFGNDNALSGSFNLKDDDNNSKTNFTLHTQDESLVKEIVHKFEDSVRMCKNAR
ncbi:hypothetical protein [Emticicia agri]|uniref:DUF4468 domain-containing protein n=1 Tax=Emticicia agri TaxID=2492393 RepID=A0A4Q5M2G7_9BACT|nr:hypothetical protein [Emticicia agri]RYU96546.1 hypothetical protein EWM59_06955 [Emticicia agri]